MRMLQVLPSVNPALGGVAEAVRQLSIELTAMGHRVEFLTLDDPHSRHAVEFPLPLAATGPSRTGYGYDHRCRKLLRENRQLFDVVIVNGLWQYHGLATWRAVANTETPSFVFTHGMLDPWFKHRYPLNT